MSILEFLRWTKVSEELESCATMVWRHLRFDSTRQRCKVHPAIQERRHVRGFLLLRGLKGVAGNVADHIQQGKTAALLHLHFEP